MIFRLVKTVYVSPVRIFKQLLISGRGARYCSPHHRGRVSFDIVDLCEDGSLEQAREIAEVAFVLRSVEQGYL